MAEVLSAGRTTHQGQGLEALRARVRAATLRPEADASGEIIADLTEERSALERARARAAHWVEAERADRRSRPLLDRMLEQRSEEHTSELQSPIDISYAVFCLK